MFLKEDVLKIRNNQEFFVEKFATMVLKMGKENPDFSPEESVYAAAIMLSYVVHDTSELTAEEMAESVKQIIDRFVSHSDESF